MKVAVVTLFPEMIEQVLDYGVLGRARKNGQLELECFNPRDFTEDKHRTVDDRPYGGGPGMLMKVEPLCRAIESARRWTGETGTRSRVVYLSPRGRKIDQPLMVEMAAEAREGEGLILVAGRYEGIDERVINTLIDEEWSIGDYVLSGGEYAALVVIDAITRLLPGTLGDELSAEEDSFMSVTVEEVRHIARLARLRLTPDEEQLMSKQLSSILDYIEQLNELDVNDVPPMTHVLDLVNATRADEVTQRITHEDALKNAPAADSDYFRVPRVIE